MDTEMFAGFQSFRITTNADPEVSIYGFKGPESSPRLPALLLLHGFPQSRHMWHRVAPQLVDKYTVVIVDIRHATLHTHIVKVVVASARNRGRVDGLDRVVYGLGRACVRTAG